MSFCHVGLCIYGSHQPPKFYKGPTNFAIDTLHKEDALNAELNMVVPLFYVYT